MENECFELQYGGSVEMMTSLFKSMIFRCQPFIFQSIQYGYGSVEVFRCFRGAVAKTHNQTMLNFGSGDDEIIGSLVWGYYGSLWESVCIDHQDFMGKELELSELGFFVCERFQACNGSIDSRFP